MSTAIFCPCHRFVWWYTDRFRVCTCGHEDGEHLDWYGTCLGDSIILTTSGVPLET